MAIFKEPDSGRHDRASEDRRRHRELVEDSIRKNIDGIIAEESIIGQSRDKKIKIPIKGLKEYKFIFGKNRSGVASGSGGEKRGDRVGIDKTLDGAAEGQAGNQEGEDIYETEVTIDELIQYLFDDLSLPEIDRKRIADIESERSFKISGYQRKGITPRLAKKRSVIEKIKRKQAVKRDIKEIDQENEGICEDDGERKRFPFIQDDLRYKRVRENVKKHYNAVIFCVMDVSGSMDQTKKYIARSFYFLLYQFIRLKYTNVEVVFIAHTTTAKEVTEEEFFHRGESGGTYISSGYEKTLEIIEQRYNPTNWNIYVFHCSDGDNWAEDNKKAIDCARKLCEVCNLFGYGEIVPGYYISTGTIKDELVENIRDRNFTVVTLSKKEDIVPGLKKLLEIEE